MVVGVSTGFSKELEIIGVGYKADVKGKKLVLNLGFSHLIEFPFPPGITIEAKAGPQSTYVTLNGYDKEHVHQVAAVIRGYRPPDSYKGKGVRYKGEVVRLKDGEVEVDTMLKLKEVVFSPASQGIPEKDLWNCRCPRLSVFRSAYIYGHH